jgi:hypothetical protein
MGLPLAEGQLEAVQSAPHGRLAKEGVRVGRAGAAAGRNVDPFRRKWATERKHYPLKDVALAGGWLGLRSVETYTQADEETIRTVVLEPAHRLVAGMV